MYVNLKVATPLKHDFSATCWHHANSKQSLLLDFVRDCVVLVLIMCDSMWTHNNIIQIIMHCLHICNKQQQGHIGRWELTMDSLPTFRNTYTANIHNTVSSPHCVAWYHEIKAMQEKKQCQYMDAKFLIQLDAVHEVEEKWRFIE